jgi:hypothetical protein
MSTRGPLDKQQIIGYIRGNFHREKKMLKDILITLLVLLPLTTFLAALGALVETGHRAGDNGL